MRMATIVLVAALLSSCGSSSTGSSSAMGDTQRDSLATTPTTEASTTKTVGSVAGSGGPCGGLSREDVEAVFGAPVRLTHRPPGYPGRLTGKEGITEEDVCAADDGSDTAGMSYRYACEISLGTFDSAAAARASFDVGAKLYKKTLEIPKSMLSPGDGEIPLSLGDASVAVVSLGSLGFATILKKDRLLDMMCTRGSPSREHGEITLNRDKFASAVRKAASQL